MEEKEEGGKGINMRLDYRLITSSYGTNDTLLSLSLFLFFLVQATFLVAEDLGKKSLDLFRRCAHLGVGGEAHSQQRSHPRAPLERNVLLQIVDFEHGR